MHGSINDVYEISLIFGDESRKSDGSIDVKNDNINNGNDGFNTLDEIAEMLKKLFLLLFIIQIYNTYLYKNNGYTSKHFNILFAIYK